MHKTKLCSVLALVFASFAASATITMIDGTNNGVSEKYNKTCLDVAYKNAKEDINGNKTDSKDFPNTKCYKDGIEIYCNEIREDGQTEKAKEDDFIEKLPDGNACVKLPTSSSKVYEGTVSSCDDITYKNAYEAVCGVPSNVSSFKCYKDHIEIDCTKLTDQAQIDKAQDACDEANAKCNLAVTCPYGGKINSSNVCECNEQPDCTGTYGGEAKGDGSQACKYYPAPDCKGTYGGRPLANGTQECEFFDAPDCTGTYGGHPAANGTQDCVYNDTPDCTGLYGGEPKANGTQECNFYDAPVCTGQYGGKPKANGTQECDYYKAPNCNKLCESGNGSPKADGTQLCNCTTEFVLTSVKKLKNSIGYEKNNYGKLVPVNLRDREIKYIKTYYDRLRDTHYTYIKFTDSPEDKTNIIMKINNIEYIFTYNSEDDRWVANSSDRIFKADNTYIITVIN